MKRRRWRGRAVACAPLLMMMLVLTPRAHATYTVIDSSNLAERIRQIAQVMRQIESVQQQIDNERRMLQKVDVSTLTGLEQALARLQNLLTGAEVYQPRDPGPDLDRRFPTDCTDVMPREMKQLREQWTQDYRQALADARSVQNAVYRDMDGARDRVETLVTASNQALGATAAMQAHNQLLAEAAGELAKLQSLKLSRARLRSEREAQKQTDEAYGRARRQWHLRGLTDLPPSRSVDPWQGYGGGGR